MSKGYVKSPTCLKKLHNNVRRKKRGKGLELKNWFCQMCGENKKPTEEKFFICLDCLKRNKQQS